MLQSIRMIFVSSAGFLEKGKIYLSAVKVFRQLDETSMIQPIQRTILETIKQKSSWKLPEEIVMLVHIYKTIYESR